MSSVLVRRGALCLGRAQRWLHSARAKLMIIDSGYKCSPQSLFSLSGTWKVVSLARRRRRTWVRSPLRNGECANTLVKYALGARELEADLRVVASRARATTSRRRRCGDLQVGVVTHAQGPAHRVRCSTSRPCARSTALFSWRPRGSFCTRLRARWLRATRWLPLSHLAALESNSLQGRFEINDGQAFFWSLGGGVCVFIAPRHLRLK